MSMQIWIPACVCVFMCGCAHACMCVCVCVNMPACVWVCMCLHVCVCMRACVYACMGVFMCVHVCSHACMCVLVNVCACVSVCENPQIKITSQQCVTVPNCFFYSRYTSAVRHCSSVLDFQNISTPKVKVNYSRKWHLQSLRWMHKNKCTKTPKLHNATRDASSHFITDNKYLSPPSHWRVH